VAAGEGHLPDWRDAGAYDPLLNAERSIFAWEWLRRNRDYRLAARRWLRRSSKPGEAGEGPERWDLHAFVPPDAAAPDARPIWRSEVHPFVLHVDAREPDGDDVFDLERFAAISTLVTAADGREHLLISDGLHSLRIDVISGSLGNGPVSLRYRLAGLAAAEKPLLTLRRLLALWRTGRFSAGLHPADARARRFILMLRAHDALASGATQREIAAELLNSEADEDRWRVRAPSLRSRVQRLVRGARFFAGRGHGDLLES
jgi:hypothetical protein